MGQQDTRGMKADPLPEISSEKKSGCSYGQQCEVGTQTQTTEQRKTLPTDVIFSSLVNIKMPYLADLTSINMYAMNKGFILFSFSLSLQSLQFCDLTQIFPKLQSVRRERAKLSSLPAPIPLNQETADCVAIELLMKNGTGKRTGENRRWWGTSHRLGSILPFYTRVFLKHCCQSWVRGPQGQWGGKEEFRQLRLLRCIKSRETPHSLPLLAPKSQIHKFWCPCKARRDQSHGLCLLQLVPLHIWNICWISLPLAGNKTYRLTLLICAHAPWNSHGWATQSAQTDFTGIQHHVTAFSFVYNETAGLQPVCYST